MFNIIWRIPWTKKRNFVDAKKLHCIVTSRQVIVYDIKTSLKSNEPIKFCVTSKIKLFMVWTHKFLQLRWFSPNELRGGYTGFTLCGCTTTCLSVNMVNLNCLDNFLNIIEEILLKLKIWISFILYIEDMHLLFSLTVFAKVLKTLPDIRSDIDVRYTGPVIILPDQMITH
jgi:hypothetical protein